ncbi:MAG: hypothetical protein JKY37_22665 [Nannocystaceae bacterium]|nr:hypothetical protein [Nannocystaceae bacterium]
MNLSKKNQALAGLMSVCFCLLGCDNSDSGGSYGDDGAGTGNGATVESDDDGEDEASAEEDSSNADADEGDDGNATPADTGGGSQDETAGDTGDDTGGETDEGSEDGDEALSFNTDVAPIIAANCSCHRSGSPPAGLDLNDGSGFASLVGVASTAEIFYVSPGDADASYIVNKLQGMQESVGGSGSQMPLGGTLQDSEIDTIIAWIDGGATE